MFVRTLLIHQSYTKRVRYVYQRQVDQRVTDLPVLQRLQLADVGHAQDGRARLVGGGQVDQGADAPVVIAGRVVEDLARRPVVPVLLDDQQPGASRVATGPDLAVR